MVVCLASILFIDLSRHRFLDSWRPGVVPVRYRIKRAKIDLVTGYQLDTTTTLYACTHGSLLHRYGVQPSVTLNHWYTCLCLTLFWLTSVGLSANPHRFQCSILSILKFNFSSNVHENCTHDRYWYDVVSPGKQLTSTRRFLSFGFFFSATFAICGCCQRTYCRNCSMCCKGLSRKR